MQLSNGIKIFGFLLIFAFMSSCNTTEELSKQENKDVTNDVILVLAPKQDDEMIIEASIQNNLEFDVYVSYEFVLEFKKNNSWIAVDFKDGYGYFIQPLIVMNAQSLTRIYDIDLNIFENIESGKYRVKKEFFVIDGDDVRQYNIYAEFEK